MPTSTKPNPSLKNELYTSAFLSKPAARPIGLEIFFPKISVDIKSFFNNLVFGI